MGGADSMRAAFGQGLVRSMLYSPGPCFHIVENVFAGSVCNCVHLALVRKALLGRLVLGVVIAQAEPFPQAGA